MGRRPARALRIRRKGYLFRRDLLNHEVDVEVFGIDLEIADTVVATTFLMGNDARSGSPSRVCSAPNADLALAGITPGDYECPHKILEETIRRVIHSDLYTSTFRPSY